jgi:Holliday junction resolvase RusA-like endonuclease
MFEVLNDQTQFVVANIVCNDKIAFRQIIKIEETVEENCRKAKGSYERNLRVYDQLSKKWMDELGQEIMYMDQAEVKSIKTVKEVVKPEKK